MLRFSVIGAGNGGQAIAGYLGLQGFEVSLYDRNLDKVEELKRLGGDLFGGKASWFWKVEACHV